MGEAEKKERIGYTLGAIVLHWGIAGLIAASFGLGAYMVRLDFSPQKLKLFSYHKWIGVSIFLFAVVRIFWRVTHPPPPPPESMPSWERAAANAVHLALYAFIVIVPVTGWLTSSAHGFQTVYFGLLPLPDLLEKNKELAERLEMLHFVLNKTLLVLAAAHVAAAFKHFFIDKDDVLKRMLRPCKLALICALVAAPAGLYAAQNGRGTSAIDFTAHQMGVPMKGSFTKFLADVRLDEKHPEKSRARITVYIDGVDAGGDDAAFIRQRWIMALLF